MTGLLVEPACQSIKKYADNTKPLSHYKDTIENIRKGNTKNALYKE